MEIRIAKSAGFCYGVRRAVGQAEALLSARQGRCCGESAAQRLVSIGPLVHNPQLVCQLQGRGLQPLQTADVRSDDIVIVRTHGILFEELAELTARGPVENATCPFVRSAQTIARRMAAKNYTVLVIGDHEHPEIASVLSYARWGTKQASRPAPTLSISSAAELDHEALGRVKRVALVAQTTLATPTLEEITTACLARFVEVRIFNTICKATIARQKEARQLAAQSDIMIVIGGRNSANTKRLFEICAQTGTRTFWVEEAHELQRSWLDGVQRVAITAGASTPQTMIEQVVVRLIDLSSTEPRV